MKIMYTAVALPAAEQKWPLQRNTASCKRWTWYFLPFPFVTFHGTYLIQNTFYKAYFKATIPFSRSPFKSFLCSLQVSDHSRQLREKMSLFSLPLRTPTPQCWNNFHSAAIFHLEPSMVLHRGHWQQQVSPMVWSVVSSLEAHICSGGYRCFY